MVRDFDGDEWTRNHGVWSAFAAAAFAKMRAIAAADLARLRAFLSWWEAHRAWPANEPARITETAARSCSGEA